VIRKFFSLDKNYLLEEAQLAQQEPLLFALIEKVKAQYEVHHNPLQLYDSFSLKIKEYRPRNIKPLSGFYQTLAGIYRYKFGNNQLEILWGGESHYEKYKRDWADTFDQWTSQFCSRAQFIQAILDLTVFLPENQQAQLAESRMNFVMLKFFDLKLNKSRVIVEMIVA
jgi:hypothetical protein